MGEELTRDTTLADGFVEGDEDWMHRPLGGVVTLVQHRSPGVEQTQGNGWVGNFVPQVVGDPAVGVDALEVRPDFPRQEKGCDVEVLIVRGRKLVAPGLRFA